MLRESLCITVIFLNEPGTYNKLCRRPKEVGACASIYGLNLFKKGFILRVSVCIVNETDPIEQINTPAARTTFTMAGFWLWHLNFYFE